MVETRQSVYRLQPTQFFDHFCLVGKCLTVDFLGIKYPQKDGPQCIQPLFMPGMLRKIIHFPGIISEIEQQWRMPLGEMDVFPRTLAQHVKSARAAAVVVLADHRAFGLRPVDKLEQ